MKIIFLTLLFEREKEEYYKKKIKTVMQNASNTFQYAVIDGIKENGMLDDLYVINSLPVGVYKSQYDELFMKKTPFMYDGKEIGKTIGCINFHIAKQSSRYHHAVQEMTEYIKAHPDEKIVIVPYNVYAPYIKACVKIVKKYKNVSFCPIVTDMPGEFCILPKVWWRRKYVIWQGKKTIKRLAYASKFVFLTDLMKEPLHVTDNYIIMEGIYSSLDKDNKAVTEEVKDKKVILYTGVLNREFGILNLIDAFNKMENKGAELWICGGSGEVEEVKRASLENSNIKYLGEVVRADSIKYQRMASLLVNPRPNEGEFVKYSFPSKTMEYLSSGNPVLMYKLAGVPDEYDEYLNYFASDDTSKMARDMESILFGDYDSYKAKAQKGKKFVLDMKNSKVQTSRMIDFLEK